MHVVTARGLDELVAFAHLHTSCDTSLAISSVKISKLHQSRLLIILELRLSASKVALSRRTRDCANEAAQASPHTFVCRDEKDSC